MHDRYLRTTAIAGHCGMTRIHPSATSLATRQGISAKRSANGFNSHPRAPRDAEAQVNWHGRDIVFSSGERNGRWEIIRGCDTPRLGWRSRHFHQKQPTTTLRIRIEIEGSTTIRTYLRINS